MANYLITGSSRGLGLALATELCMHPSSAIGLIFATARSSTPSLQTLIGNSNGRVVFVELDATNEASVSNAVKYVESVLGAKDLDGGLDVLINNAGIMPATAGGVQEMMDLDQVLQTNVSGVQMVTRAFLPLLRKGREKKVFNISSTLGSMTMAPRYPFPTPAYKISKAALNMLTVQYAIALAGEGFIFVALSPGWLQTDMGSADADLPVEVGAKAVLDNLFAATEVDNGKFANIHVPGWEENPGFNQYDGKTPPW